MEWRGFKITGPWGMGIEVAGKGPRLGPSTRGLSDARIAAELELYEAILRLQKARHDFPKAVRVPGELDADIRRFWAEPESIGMRAGGEDDVRNLAKRVREFTPGR